jgi:hypothetical protein
MKKCFLLLIFLLISNFGFSQNKFNGAGDIVMAAHITERELWRFTYIDMWQYTKPENTVKLCDEGTIVRGGLTVSYCKGITITILVNQNLTYIATFHYKSNDTCRVIISKIESGVDYDLIDEERSVVFKPNDYNRRMHVVSHNKDFTLITDDWKPLYFGIYDDSRFRMYCFTDTKITECK